MSAVGDMPVLGLPLLGLGWPETDWSPALLAVLGLAALAVLLAVPPPAGRRLARLTSGPLALPPIVQRIRGRPRAAPLSRRLALGVAGAAGLCAAVATLVPAAGLAVWLAGLPLGLGIAVLLGLLPSHADIRREAQLVQQVPQALELVAACLAAGMPVRRGVAAVATAFDGPVAEELRGVSALIELGAPEVEAWQALRAHPQLGPAAADLARSVDSGTLLVEALQRHAADARSAREAALQIRARAVGVRTVLPLMTCFIPSFLLLGVVPSLISAFQHAFG